MSLLPEIICVLIYIHICIYTYIHRYIYTYIHICIYTYIHVYICICTHIYVDIYIYTHHRISIGFLWIFICLYSCVYFVDVLLNFNGEICPCDLELAKSASEFMTLKQASHGDSLACRGQVTTLVGLHRVPCFDFH
jgi:hypothetical protein